MNTQDQLKKLYDAFNSALPHGSSRPIVQLTSILSHINEDMYEVQINVSCTLITVRGKANDATIESAIHFAMRSVKEQLQSIIDGNLKAESAYAEKVLSKL